MNLEPGRSVNAFDLPAVHEPLPAGQVRKGAPTTWSAELGDVAAGTIGIWEITPGVSSDVESDEVFVVLSGRGRIDFAEAGHAPLDLRPGDVVRLRAGMRTVWTVTETLRKLWIG